MKNRTRPHPRPAPEPGPFAAPAGSRTGQPVALELDDEWRRWIAENLLLGSTPAFIISHLVRKGCPVMLAQREIAHAQASPYLKGAAVLQQRLAKRDWLLACASRLEAIGDDGAIPRRHHALPADQFFREHYAAHRPATISGLIDHWPARHSWSLDHFEALLDNPLIEVQAGREADPAYEQRSPDHKKLLPFAEILALLREDRATNDFYITANNGAHNRNALAPLWAEIGPIPVYLDAKSDRDGFFWMGPRGTITPWHHDLTNNLLIQICGRKRISLVSSNQTALMRNHLHCYSTLPGPSSLETLPVLERPRILSCILEPGDAIFIPVGWWHHVEGLDVTIGMSFTNFAWDNDFSSFYTTYDQV